MADVALTFFFFAVVLLLGFVSSRIFQTTRFPDIPILLSMGLLLGPLNRVLVDYGSGSRFLVDNISADQLKQFAPFVSSLALIVILFDAGLKLDFLQFRQSMKPAFAHTLPLFALTVTIIALVANFVMGLPPLLSVILAVALSNVGQTVSAAIIREIDLSQQVRSIYFIEMALYDLFSIPLLVGLLEFAQGGGVADNADLLVRSLAKTISISIFMGVAGGMIWIYVLRRLREYPYTYMVTLAGLLLINSVTSFLDGSGPVSVLIFGLVIGNRASILKALGQEASPQGEGAHVHSFHDEITFFVRSFFFVFLGLTFSLGVRGTWSVSSKLPILDVFDNTAALFLLGVALIFLGIVVARFLVVRYISARNDPERLGLYVVYGRGLGTAVLATFPFTLETYQPDAVNPDAFTKAYTDLFAPWEVVFVNTALLIILLTVMGSSLSVWLQERRKSTESPARSARVTGVKE